MDLAVHTESFDAAAFRIVRNKDHTDAALDFNIGITVEMEELGQESLCSDPFCLSNEAGITFHTVIFINGAEFCKCGTCGFVLHNNYLQWGNYSTF